MAATNVVTEESWLTLKDSHKLYTKTWKAVGTPKARLIFIHGFSDHVNMNNDYLLAPLASAGITIYAFDQRGWGHSVQIPAQKGLTGPTEMVLDDITSFIRSVIAHDGDGALPLFLMGHSMGGAEVLHYATDGPPEVLKRFRGFITEAPFVALHPATRPWGLTVALGRLAGKVLPRMHTVSYTHLTLPTKRIV